MLSIVCRLQYLKSVLFAVAAVTFMMSVHALADENQPATKEVAKVVAAPASVEFETDEDGALIVENKEALTVFTNTPATNDGYSTGTKIAAGVTFAALTVVTGGLLYRHRKPILNSVQNLFQRVFGRGQAVVQGPIQVQPPVLGAGPQQVVDAVNNAIAPVVRRARAPRMNADARAAAEASKIIKSIQ